MTGAIIYGWVLFKALRAAQWWRLRNPDDVNVLLYTMLGIVILWSINTDIRVGESPAGPTLHLLGATLMTLMFGWAYAVLAMSLVIIVFILFTAPAMIDSLLILPWDILLTGVLPVSLSYMIYRLVDHYLPNNYFIYLFLSAFFSAALTLASVILATSIAHAVSGSYSIDNLLYSYIPYGLILVFPEAFVTGMLMSVFVVYRPEWVSTFDDERYLRNR